MNVTLKDGTSFYTTPDGVGNMICSDRLDKDIFSDDNLARLTIEENGAESVYENQILRTFYYQDDGSTFIRIDDKSEMELLKTEYETAIQMLTDCLLEMSEAVYA